MYDIHNCDVLDTSEWRRLRRKSLRLWNRSQAHIRANAWTESAHHNANVAMAADKAASAVVRSPTNLPLSRAQRYRCRGATGRFCRSDDVFAVACAGNVPAAAHGARPWVFPVSTRYACSRNCVTREWRTCVCGFHLFHGLAAVLVRRYAPRTRNSPRLGQGRPLGRLWVLSMAWRGSALRWTEREVACLLLS